MKLQSLNASYKDQVIYENMTIDFDHVGMTFIKGDSGAGKTTLLNILYGLKEFEGDYIVDGELEEFIRNNISYIFQDFKVDTNLTVIENIQFQLDIKNIEIDEDEIDDLLYDLDMLGNKNKKVKVLSGGEKQRLAIARTLLTKTPVLLCDEPTGNLDESTSIEIFDLLKEISKEKLVLVVSHSEFLIDRYADVIYEIIDKKLVKTKECELDRLSFNQLKFGEISKKKLIKKSIFNTFNNFTKKISIFIVFSFLSALFLLLSFSNENIDKFLEEKYKDKKFSDVIYVKFKMLHSVDYLSEFTNKLNFDTYFLHNLNETSKNIGGHYFTFNHLNVSDYIVFNPNFYKDRDSSLDLTKVSVPVATVGNLDVLGNSLIYGRLPNDNSEVLINKKVLSYLLDLYNERIDPSSGSDKYIDIDTLTNKTVINFLEDAKVSSMYYDLDIREYIPETLAMIKFKVVGVVDDKTYAYDYSVPVKRFNWDSSLLDGMIYTSPFYLNKSLQIRSRNFFDILERVLKREVPAGSIHAIDVFNDNSKNMYDEELYQILKLYREDLNINNIQSIIEEIESFDDVKKVMLSELIVDATRDLEYKRDVLNQIRTYSSYLLLIAFITAFVPYYFMTLKRKEEFEIYKILGIDGRKRFIIFLIEFIITIMIVTLMVIGFYFLMLLGFKEQIEEFLRVMIYSTSKVKFLLEFKFKYIAVIFGVLLPFLFTYRVLKISKGEA